jgi:hypothetical protein
MGGFVPRTMPVPVPEFTILTAGVGTVDRTIGTGCLAGTILGGTIGFWATGNEVLGADAGTTVLAGLGQVGDFALGVLLTCAGASGC